MEKRRVALILTVAMLLSVLSSVAFSVGFIDMPNNWSTAALEKAVENGLLKGDKGKIRAEDSLTRAEMATIVNRAFKAVKTSSLKGFEDVVPGDWYYKEMGKAVEMKIFKGTGNKLNPNQNITREEAFVVLARAFKISEIKKGILNKFSDKDNISDWASDEVSALISAGYIAGSSGQINPKENITRAEFAQIMDNLVKTYITKDGKYVKDYEGNVMINKAGVTLKGITVDGDLIIGDGVGDGEVTLDGVTVKGRVVVRGGGENSIRIIGNSSVQNIIIARADGKVRVYSEEGVEIGEVTIDGNDDVILEGEFEGVTIVSEDIKVVAKNANIKSVTSLGPNAALEVDENSTIDNVVANGNDTIIEGNGKVKKVAANGNNVSVNTKGTQVTAGKDTTGVTVGDKKVEAGKTETGIPPVTPTPPVTGGGGYSGGDGNDDVAVTGISINKKEMRLVVGGGTGTLEETVSPKNATNKMVTWASSDIGVVTVVSGVVTPVAAGTANITATAGGETAEVIVTVYAAESVITTVDGLETELTNADVTDITIGGTLGSDSREDNSGKKENGYTIYNVNREVTIRGIEGAKVFGTFIVKADGVTIDNLAIENKGDLGTSSSNNRGGIYAFAENVTITNNKITNGLGTEAGLSNAIQIMSPTAGKLLSAYKITGNTLKGHNNEATNWSSSGIVIAQGYNPGSAGGAYVQAITATEADYQNLLDYNTFENNAIDLTHQDWSLDAPKDEEKVIYPYPIVGKKEELERVLNHNTKTKVIVNGTIGGDSAYTIYQVDRAVTIQGAEGAKVYGTFIVKADGVTIDNLAIENKGNIGTENNDDRSAIKVYGKNVTITNNKITNGMGEVVGLSNAIQIQTEEASSLLNYVIENNEFINNEKPSDKWKSTDILMQEGFGNYKAITAFADDYQSILDKNILSGDVIEFAHMDYGKTINGTIYLFRSPLGKVTGLNDKIAAAEEKVEADYTAETWTALQTALTAAKNVADNIANEDGTYQAEIIKANDALGVAIEGLETAED